MENSFFCADDYSLSELNSCWRYETQNTITILSTVYNSEGSTLSFSGSHISSNWNVFENNPGVLSASDSRKEALIFYDCCQILLPPTFNFLFHDKGSNGLYVVVLSQYKAVLLGS